MPKTVFITGASSGIGLASAKLFHEKGWNVVATMRTPENSELYSLDTQRMLILPLDIRDLSAISAAVEAAVARFHGIDLLVNNAGYGQNGVFEMIPREKIQQQFDVNVFGVMDVTRAVLPHMRAHKAGGIINVSSGAGVFTLPMISIYCASKFALEGFTEALAYELAAQGITVKSVIPHGGVTATNFIARANADAGRDPAAAADYAGWIQKTMGQYGKMVAGRSISADDVAAVIFEAATDGKDKLRYFVGNDTRGFIKARYESNTDEEYVAHLRSCFKD